LSREISKRAEFENALHTNTNPRHGLAIHTSWKILEHAYVPWTTSTSERRGFMFAKLQHPSDPQLRLTLYTLNTTIKTLEQVYADAPLSETLLAQNMIQIATHIQQNARDDAVILAGNFNWKHMWRPLDARPDVGYIEKTYNDLFTDANSRWDALAVLTQLASMVDAEYLATKTLDHLAPVDKVFIRQGKDTKITLTKREYLYKHTPWTGLSRKHHPVSIDFELSHQPI